MLMQQKLENGVHSVVVSGSVGVREANSLLGAVQAALAQEPRGVVVDLTAAAEVTGAAFTSLSSLRALPSGWPRASVAFCPARPDLVAGLVGLSVHTDHADAVRRVDDRSDAPRERVDLRASLDSPAQARAVVAACADRLGLEELRDDLTLVVSEMVTNAVRHAGPPVAIEIQADLDTVLIAVNDGSPVHPQPRPAGADAEGGRGLLLVDLLSVEHGVRPDPPGKTVWAALRRRQPFGHQGRTGAALPGVGEPAVLQE